jgi:prevent-host-death family protein
MKTVNIHEAKTHLSRLLEGAVKGESFVIAKAGRPIAKVTAIGEAERPKTRRLGFLAGRLAVPADFDCMGGKEIGALFGGKAS